jgi:hypothetical protein
MTRPANQATLMDQPTKDAEGQPESTALVPAQESAVALLPMIERLASNPNFDVAKLEKLIEMQERILARQAHEAFEAAFSEMQPEIPEIDERGRILVKGSLRSTYAKLEDIHLQIKPILAKHGFAIRHRTEWPKEKAGTIRIVGILSHKQGHSEESAFEAPMDKSEYRTDIQSMGSTVSYGRRYTTLDLLNITTRGMDNDGQRPQQQPRQEETPKPPKGFTEQLVADLEAAADEGWPVLQKVWKSWTQEQRDYLNQINRDLMNKLKAKAQKVKVQA